MITTVPGKYNILCLYCVWLWTAFMFHLYLSPHLSLDNSPWIHTLTLPLLNGIFFVFQPQPHCHISLVSPLMYCAAPLPPRHWFLCLSLIPVFYSICCISQLGHPCSILSWIWPSFYLRAATTWYVGAHEVCMWCLYTSVSLFSLLEKLIDLTSR